MEGLTSHGARIRFLAAELVIVIVGVIIALGLEAWWTGLQDDDRAHEHVVALHDEFRTNLDTLQGNIARIENIKLAATSLLHVMVGTEDRPSPDSLVALTWEAFSFPVLRTTHD